MTDPTIIIGTGLAVLGSKDVLTKILGPTADYLGNEAKGLVEKCNINLNSVFERAKRKLGERIDQPGAVSPRVLRHILDDARFCEDELAAEYYGGLLAGSRELGGTDDRSLPYLSKVKQMSVYQIRLHFAFYYEVLRHHKDAGLNLGVGTDCGKAGLVIPHEFLIAFLPPADLSSKYWSLMSHSVVGLHSLGLIGSYGYGDIKSHLTSFTNASENAIYMAPTFSGAELFMWALGLEMPSGHQFFKTDIATVEKTIPILENTLAKNRSES